MFWSLFCHFGMLLKDSFRSLLVYTVSVLIVQVFVKCFFNYCYEIFFELHHCLHPHTRTSCLRGADFFCICNNQEMKNVTLIIIIIKFREWTHHIKFDSIYGPQCAGKVFVRARVQATYDHIWASVGHVIRSCACRDARANCAKHQSHDRAIVDHVVVSTRKYLMLCRDEHRVRPGTSMSIEHEHGKVGHHIR